MVHTGSVVGGVVNKDPVYVIAVLVEVLDFLVPARPHVQRHRHPQILSAGVELVTDSVQIPATQQPCEATLVTAP